jgi:hypothetical protein
VEPFRSFLYCEIKSGNKYSPRLCSLRLSVCSPFLRSRCEKCFTTEQTYRAASFRARVIYAINCSKSYIHQVAFLAFHENCKLEDFELQPRAGFGGSIEQIKSETFKHSFSLHTVTLKSQMKSALGAIKKRCHQSLLRFKLKPLLTT